MHHPLGFLLSCSLSSYIISGTIIGLDDREPILNTSTLPYAAVGQIQINTTTVCTGTLVSPNYVLTAASCLYFNGQPLFQDLVSLGFQLQGSTSSVEKILSVTQIPERRVGLDYAYLQLSESLGHTFGYINVSLDLDLTEKTLELISTASVGGT